MCQSWLEQAVCPSVTGDPSVCHGSLTLRYLSLLLLLPPDCCHILTLRYPRIIGGRGERGAVLYSRACFTNWNPSIKGLSSFTTDFKWEGHSLKLPACLWILMNQKFVKKCYIYSGSGIGLIIIIIFIIIIIDFSGNTSSV